MKMNWSRILQRSPVAVFVIKMLLFVSLTGPIFYFELGHAAILDPLSRFTARCTQFILWVSGVSSTLSGDTITLPSFAVKIVWECTGIAPLILLVSGVLAAPVSWGTRGRCLLAGAVLVFVLNQVRILSILWVGTGDPSLADELHENIWQPVFVLVVAVYWFRWITVCSRRGLVRWS